jgi:broad specificity phosphatase PhoE
MFLYIVRHGQSTSNAGGSEPDAQLTDIGHEQARRTGAALAHPVDRGSAAPPLPTIVVSSPMRRALQTAHHIADALGFDAVRVRGDVHECCGPTPEFLTRETIRDEFPRVRLDDSMPESGWWPAHDETPEDRIRRGRRAADWIRATFGGSDEVVVVVTHGVFGSYLIAAMFGTDSMRWSIGHNNCGISLVDLDATRHGNRATRVWFMNETTHLWPDLLT